MNNQSTTLLSKTEDAKTIQMVQLILLVSLVSRSLIEGISIYSFCCRSTLKGREIWGIYLKYRSTIYF